MSNADMVIFHGGHNTMTESVVCGKPTITVPFHSEQEGNGRRLEQGGCGLVVKLSKESYKRVEAKWMYGTYSLMVQSRYDLTPEQLSEKVEEILSCSAYTDRTLMLQKKIREYQGPEKAVDLIEKAGGRYEITM
jgi:UDP:flavonoid glycosyltransferase YjiC (YdhE family)